MSENITHTAVVDDCVRLALHSPRICAPFKLCLRKHLEFARLGGVTRAGGKFVAPLLERYRAVWPEHQDDGVLQAKTAFVLGWLFHRAADLQMKPIFKAVDGDCPLDPTDCSVYHDVFLLREVFGGGSEDPYTPQVLDLASSPMARGVDVAALEGFFRTLWQRALIGMHTFIPDQADVDGWLERLFALRQDFYVDIRRYAEALTNPDPDKMRRFIVEVRFYDPQDGLIRLARSIQRGVPDEGVDLAAAIEAAAGQSQYAQALRRGCLYVQAASDYFGGTIDGEGFKDALERGAQGVV